MALVPKLIDAWVQPWTSVTVAAGLPARRKNPYMEQRYGQDRKRHAIPISQLVDEMDESGIDFALASAGPHIPMSEVLLCLEAYPDRFAAVAWCDPTQGVMEAVRGLRHLVECYRIVGFRLEPFLLDRVPTDRIFYPIFAACVDLGIALCVQVGGTAPLYSSRSGHPMYIDDIALDFPELRIVCGHIGTPWVDEMIHVASKHANVYIDTSARLPKHFEPQFAKFVRTWGQDKCMFASDWPILPFTSPVSQLDDLGLSDTVRRKFCAENAMRAFELTWS